MLSATARFRLFLVALATVVACVTAVILGASRVLLLAAALALVSLAMNVARPYVFRGRS
jgi:hypothetical protein